MLTTTRKFGQACRYLLLLGMGLLLTTGLFAQGQVTGTVTGPDGESLAGATVLVQGTTRGVFTDDNGKYSIQAGTDNVLVVSYLGYLTKAVPVTGSVVNVSLAVDDITISEVVVTGYATQRKEDLTGSVSVISAEDLVAQPSGNVANQLQGRAAGVSVTQDGRPGSPSKVRIRGFGSFQNNDPLYVVDGVPTQDISTLNPNDIATLTVLKDAGAASIYGSRASNGVVVITTKRGSEGVKVNYNMYVGSQNPGDGPQNLLNARGYADLQWLVYNNDGTNETHPFYGPSPAAGGPAQAPLPSWAADTDWWNEITQNALIQNHDVSLSGGNKNAHFFAGFNYFDQQGIVIETNAKRLSARFNSDYKIKDRVTIGENLTITQTSRGRGIGNLAEGTSIDFLYRAQSIIPATITTPITGISHDFVEGEFGGTGISPRLGNGDNPLAVARRDADDFRFDVRILGSAYADVKILEGLNFRSTFGGSFRSGYYNDYTYATYENAENVATAAFQEGADYGGDWVWTNALTLDKDFGANSLLVVAGYEAVKYDMGRGVFGRRAGYFSDAVSFRTLDNGATIVNASSYNITPTTLVSNFARVDYGYDNRYLVSATVRRDGSSRFGPDTRFGVFPSVSVGWRVSQESFLIDNKIISNMKIRGGYGTMGNQLALTAQNQFTLFGGETNTSNYDLTGAGSSSLQGFRPTQIGNPDAKWETNVTANAGVEMAFLDNRLELIFDWYLKQTVDLLYNPELPGTAGAATPPFLNVAEMQNSGIDLQLIYRDNFASDLNFEANLTLTTYNNEIVQLADGVPFFDAGDSRIGSFSRNQPGFAIGQFFGYEVVGLFQSQEEVDNAATQDGAAPGFFRYADTDEDGVITPDDRTFIGDPNPDFTYGLNLSLEYKGFDVTAFIFGSQGNEIFNYTKWWTDFWPSFQGQKSTDLLNNSWTPTNTGATVPKASNTSNFSTNTQSMSYYIENGSFTRLKNLQLGYTFSPEVGNKLGLGSARIYLQGTNLFTLTQYSGMDPEISGSDTSFGVDEGNYPVVKQFLVGLNLGF
ncbi:MAG: TonB-dependent receptor [Bacteroidia bacterium]|nr:TonB-dependent receptor [Bacteroidia bacterium]